MAIRPGVAPDCLRQRLDIGAPWGQIHRTVIIARCNLGLSRLLLATTPAANLQQDLSS
jgi:hypothetical protein